MSKTEPSNGSRAVPPGVPEVVWTIVVAAGSGERFGRPKQFERLGPTRMVDLAMSTARGAGAGTVLVVPAADAEREGGIPGGATRSESVRAGLAAVPGDATIVCVHDAARPFATRELFNAVIDAVRAGADGAVPGIAVADTIKRVRLDGEVIETPRRETLVAVQTPQAFRAAALRAAHCEGTEATDDAALVESAGGRVVVVAGESSNRKITTLDDLRWAHEQIAETTR